MDGVLRMANDNRTLAVLVFVVAWLLYYQKQVYVAEQEDKQSLHFWLKDHGLEKYIDSLDKAGIKTKDGFIKLKISKFLDKYFPHFNKQENSLHHHQLEIHILKLNNLLNIYYWLEKNGVEKYYEDVIGLGFQDMSDIKDNLSKETMERLTKHEHSRSDYSRLQYALKKLKSAGSEDQGSFLPSILYYPLHICFQLIWSLWWIFRAVAKAVGYLLFSFFTLFKLRRLVTNTRSECQRRKLTLLNYALGNYLYSKRANIKWQWREPVIVGQVMTFVIEFYRFNFMSYPVNQRSGISIEILHSGSVVATSCEYGGASDNESLESNKVKVTFTVRQAGEYSIAVLLAGDHVSGSPFTKVFLPGPVEPSKCSVVDKLSMLVVRRSTYSPLLVQAKDKYGNTCAITNENDVNKFKVVITKIGSTNPINPELFVDTSEYPIANVLHIKLEGHGCYTGVITYDGAPIDNNVLTILSLTMNEWDSVMKNIEKHCYNVWYESSLLVPVQQDNQPTTECDRRTMARSASQNGINLTVSSLNSNTYKVSSKKIYCYISPKNLTIKEFYLRIIPHRLHAFRVSPRTKLTLHPPNSSFEHPTFTLNDGIQPPVSIMCKERNVLVATFSRLVLSNIGGSETFKKKQEFFYQKLLSKHGSKFGCTNLKIDRRNLLESSFSECKSLYNSDWLRLFSITFKGEEGLDWGGVRREWFDLLSGLLFGHENKLFTRFSDDTQALVHPNPRRSSSLKLKYYEFAGRIVGKCLYESAVGATRRQNVKAKFTRSFLAQLLGQRVTYKHFETDDKQLYRSKIQYIEENDPEDLDLKFEEECYSEGQLVKTEELKPGGSQIPVTQENKYEYLDLLAQYTLVSSCQQEVESFLKGLNELVPDSLLSIFDENELELVMCGTGHISVADMKANHNNIFGRSSSKVIDWFWTIISSFTQEELARLVQFVTGSSQLPPGGFSDLSPTLQIGPVPNTDTLPIAHTCFNQLCLPNYSSFEEMQKMLLIAITEGCEGFGFA